MIQMVLQTDEIHAEYHIQKSNTTAELMKRGFLQSIVQYYNTSSASGGSVCVRILYI